MPSATASHPTLSPLQPSSSRPSVAARSVREHEKQGSCKVTQPGQRVVVLKPLFGEMRHSEPGAPVFWRERPDVGCVAPSCVYLRGLEHIGRVEHEAGGEGYPEERGHITSSPRLGLLCCLQPFSRLRVPQAFRARPANHRGLPAHCGVGVSGACAVGHHRLHSRAHSAPTMCASHAVMELRRMIHDWKSAPRRWLEKPPGRSWWGCGVGRAQVLVSPVRPRVVELFPLCDCAERLHGGGPQVAAAVMAGIDELGVAGARRRVPQDGVLGRRLVRLVQQRVAAVGDGPRKPKWVLGVVPAHARAVLKPPQGHLVDRLCCTRGDPRGSLAVRVPQEVEDDVGLHRMDPRPAGAVLQGEGGGHRLRVGYRARDGHCPCAGEVGSEGDPSGVPAGPAPRCVGGRVAPWLWDPSVPGGAEPPRVGGGGVPLDVAVAGGQLVHARCQSVVRADCRVVVESDLSSVDRARPGLERRSVLPEPCRAAALVHQQVPCVPPLVLQRVYRHVWIVWHPRSH